jgi:hypothetical protein
MSREFLVTKLVCSKCGSSVNLSYDQIKGRPLFADGEPTGAARVENVVVVAPCDTCYEPIRTIQRALRDIKEVMNTGEVK